MGYLIMLGAILVAIGGAYFKGHQRGVTSGVESQRPTIERLQKDSATARAANGSLQADLDVIRGKADACNATVDQLGKAAEAAKAAQATARNAAAARKATAEADIAKRQQSAATAASRTPTQQCEAARSVLGDLADRQREELTVIPEPVAAPVPAKPLEQPKAVPPTPAGPLPSAIRRPR